MGVGENFMDLIPTSDELFQQSIRLLCDAVLQLEQQGIKLGKK